MLLPCFYASTWRTATKQAKSPETDTHLSPWTGGVARRSARFPIVVTDETIYGGPL